MPKCSNCGTMYFTVHSCESKRYSGNSSNRLPYKNLSNTNKRYNKEYDVYMVRTSSNKLYTGISKNVDKRIHEHNHTKRGAKSLRGQLPVELVWKTSILVTKPEALSLERKLKKMSKAEKEELVKYMKENKKVFSAINQGIVCGIIITCLRHIFCGIDNKEVMDYIDKMLPLSDKDKEYWYKWFYLMED